MGKFLAIIFVFWLFLLPTYAGEKVQSIKNFKAILSDDFEPNNFPEYVQFVTNQEVVLKSENIPANATIRAKVIEAQPELRWHKSGFFLCQLIDYTSDNKNYNNLSDKNIYLIARRYEALDKKGAGILTAEIIITSGVSIFAPGVDVGYFFIKGAIQREKHSNWFKAGVHNAYDNSIFWFPQKGKNINMQAGEEVYIKPFKEQKVDKLKCKVVKRKYRVSRQMQNKQIKAELKALHKELRNENDL